MILGMILVALLLGAPSAFGADLSVCTLPDGQKVYTNKAQDSGNCEPYEPQSKLGYIYRKGGSPLPYIEAVIPDRPERLVPAQPNGEAPALRDMPFEVFRMLSVGM